ncbi:MAG: hypothetical protein ACR2JY_09885 [Chloroflexota bacterium]
MPNRNDALPFDITLREVIAAQLLIASGERIDAEALASLNSKLDAQLDAFRHHLGTVRFGAILKNAWRRSAPTSPNEDE